MTYETNYFFFIPNICDNSDLFITLFNSENERILYNLGLYISRTLQCNIKDLLTKVIHFVGQTFLNDILFYIITYS